MQKVGLLGGTFDPPHFGHLMIAQEVLEKLQLDEIWFIPSNEPPHKEKSGTSVAHRVQMVEAAVADNPRFRLIRIEVERAGKSYTIDTVKLLHEKYPDLTFYFIIGADMVEYLPHWYKIEELTKLVQFVGVKRIDYELNSDYPVIPISVPSMDISSTMVREKLLKRQSVQYFIPKAVWEVIKEYHVYE